MPLQNIQHGYSRSPEVIKPSENRMSKKSPVPAEPHASMGTPRSPESAPLQTPTGSPFSSNPNMTGSSSQVAGGGKPFGVKSSTPKEPSKLRFSYQPDSSQSTPPSAVTMSQTEQKAILDPKAIALEMDVTSLPVYAFPFKECSNNIDALYHIKAITPQSDAKAVPLSTLPMFDFSQKVNGATTGFNWAAAGLKPPPKVRGESWTCSTCMLSNPSTAENKCTICDSPRS
jgi:hypothetical protein